MTAHLLALTVGPVQEFIAAARRTRDLWFGSRLLSEISKAVAQAVQDRGGRLIFPAPQNDVDLDRDSSLNVANVILAELSQSDPAAVAQEAKAAARSRWREFAGSVFQAHQSAIRRELWDAQVDDVIEFYAAWHPYTPQTYPKDRTGLMRLLAARKRCRDFESAKGRAGVAKSSLDGRRESVIRPSEGWPEGPRRRLRLSEGEQLDVIGMVKRTWPPEEKQAFPSVARIAADPWLRTVSRSPHFDELVQACRALGGEVVHELDTSSGGHPQFATFPFEGSAVFRSRHCEFRREVELSESALDPLRKALCVLAHECGEPSPYVGVLVADGDRMGQALSNLPSPDDHRGFSRALASFAGKARAIVNNHSGVLVYAGGDDVLAFVPVDRCLECARALHDTFGGELASWATQTRTELTLSVGLAIAHFMEPLEDLLDYGRAAEKHAKRPRPEDARQEARDSLAVHLVKRGGGPLAVRANWAAEPDKHLTHLKELIDKKAVSGGVAYDLHKIAHVYDNDSWDVGTVKDAIRRDTLSVMQGKRPRGASRMEEINVLIQHRVMGADSLRSLANELLVARALVAGANSR